MEENPESKNKSLTKILCVEDNEIYREKVYKPFLEMTLPGCYFDFASCKEEAEKYLSKNKYSIVTVSRFLDCSLDGGLDLTIKIKEEHPETKVILATTRPINENLSDYGIDHIFIKNIDYTIKNVIEEVIESTEL